MSDLTNCLQGLIAHYHMTASHERIVCDAADRIRELEARLRAVVKDCAGCFRTAAEDIQSWGEYASDYFQNKHGLKVEVERYKNKAAELEALLK